ncbi:MAG: hypothetical protein ACUVRR_05460, partial [Candidatus Fervidibacter sp.]
MQAIKLSGEPLRYEDIVSPILPSLNAALIYQQAFQSLTLSFRDKEILDEFRTGHPNGNNIATPTTNHTNLIVH